MKRHAWSAVIIAVLFAGAGAYFGMTRMTADAPTDTAVENLLSLSLPDAHGANQSLAKWKVRPLVVNFWATWCAPCIDEMPELSALQTQLGKDDVRIIGIGIDSQANIAEFADKYRVAYPLYVGGMSAIELSRQLGNKAGGLPFTILIDANGKVRQTYLGRLKMDALRKDLADLQGKT